MYVFRVHKKRIYAQNKLLYNSGTTQYGGEAYAEDENQRGDWRVSKQSDFKEIFQNPKIL